MLRSIFRSLIPLVLLVLLMPGLAQAASWSIETMKPRHQVEDLGLVARLYDQFVALFLQWGNDGASAKNGGQLEPNGGKTENGGQLDPNGTPNPPAPSGSGG